MKIQNNFYDTLRFPVNLTSTGKYSFLSDATIMYLLKNDSLLLIDTSDALICEITHSLPLLKGQTQIVYFQGYCSENGGWYQDKSQIYKYKFAFSADSLGQKKYFSLWEFPCGSNYPIKK